MNIQTPKRFNYLLPILLALAFQACASNSSKQQALPRSAPPSSPNTPQQSSPGTTESNQNPPSESGSDLRKSTDTGQPEAADETQSDQQSTIERRTAEGDANSAQITSNDISDGSDDDTVARQLREAAEAETDPVLRERLWEEYRNYKKTTQ